MNQPFVFMNMASSADGKSTDSNREMKGFGSKHDKRMMQNLRLQADAVIIGSGTLVADNARLALTSKEYIGQYRTAKGKDQPDRIVISKSLEFHPQELDFFTKDSAKKIVVTSIDACRDKIRKLENYSDIILVPENDNGKLNLSHAMQELYSKKIEYLLLEGGATLNFEMLKAGIVEEIYITLCPFIFGGGGTPTIVDGSGFTLKEVQDLNLLSCNVADSGEIFLHYSTVNKKT